jgi:hypothetical protein
LEIAMTASSEPNAPRRAVLGGLALAALAAGARAAPPATRPGEDPALTAHRHDFDWLVGSWKVRHHRLKGRLVGSTEWEDFDGTSKLWLTLDGLGTVDDNLLELPGGTYRAVGIRAFDPKTSQWAIWWLDGRNPSQIDVPVRGGFKDGVGTFEADDTLNGKPIRVRFEWSRITKNSAHWEQAFSPDGGRTWEVNWRMDFTRA